MKPVCVKQGPRGAVASENPPTSSTSLGAGFGAPFPPLAKEARNGVPRSNLSLGHPKNYFSTRMNSPEEALTATVNLAVSRLEP
jgi:hypothetical protein